MLLPKRMTRLENQDKQGPEPVFRSMSDRSYCSDCSQSPWPPNSLFPPYHVGEKLSVEKIGLWGCLLGVHSIIVNFAIVVVVVIIIIIIINSVP